MLRCGVEASRARRPFCLDPLGASPTFSNGFPSSCTKATTWQESSLRLETVRGLRGHNLDCPFSAVWRTGRKLSTLRARVWLSSILKILLRIAACAFLTSSAAAGRKELKSRFIQHSLEQRSCVTSEMNFLATFGFIPPLDGPVPHSAG